MNVDSYELIDLSDIAEGESIYIAPAGFIARKLYKHIHKERPDIEVISFLDSNISSTLYDVKVNKIELLNRVDHENECSNRVVIAHEFRHIYEQILVNLKTAGFNNVVVLKRTFISTMLSDYVKWKFRSRFFQRLFSIPKLYKKEKNLLVFLDYKLFPYDFSAWVLFQNINFELKRQECTSFDLVIINDRCSKRDDQDYIDDDKSAMLIQNMVIDGLVMIKNLRNTYYFQSRWQAFLFYSRNFYKKLFPENYTMLFSWKKDYGIYEYLTGHTHYSKYTQNKLIDEGQEITYFEPPAYAVNHVDKWMKMHGLADKNTITMTLRNTRNEGRNSHVYEWAKAAQHLSRRHDVSIIVVPDYYDIYDTNLHHVFADSATICNEAAASIRFRLALYYQSTLNMDIECGITVFNDYIDKPYLSFKKVMDKDNMDYFNRLYYGESWYHFKDYQKVVWEDDTSENIIAEAEIMLEKIL